MLDIVDYITRECLRAVVDTPISGRRVVREPTDPVAERGTPKMIVSDNGTKLTSNAVLSWSEMPASGGTILHREADTERVRRELQWSHARRAAERDAVPDAEPGP